MSRSMSVAQLAAFLRALEQPAHQAARASATNCSWKTAATSGFSRTADIRPDMSSVSSDRGTAEADGQQVAAQRAGVGDVVGGHGRRRARRRRRRP